MAYDFAITFMVFITYAFLGKIGETVYYSYLNKRYTSRGFLIGPYLPIWGLGAIILGPILNLFKSNLIIVIILSVFLGGLIEYIASYILEKIYDARWWDYSDMKLNLNGRICLTSCTTFGILGLIYVYIFNGPYIGLLKSINHGMTINIAIIIFLAFIIDVVVSKTIARELNRKGKLKDIDCTEEVKQELRKILFNK